MKKLILMSVMAVSLGLLSIAAVTAEGVQEGQDESAAAPAPGYRTTPWTAPAPGTFRMSGRPGAPGRFAAPGFGAATAPGRAAAPATPGYFYNSEKLSLEGTVDFTVSGAELTAADGKVYDLMYPRFLADGIDIEDGETIAVEGYLVPGPRWEWDNEDTNLRVTMATINGKEYDLAPAYGPAYSQAYGPGYGPGARAPQAGTYGPGYNPGMRGSGAQAPPNGAFGPGMMGGYGYRR